MAVVLRRVGFSITGEGELATWRHLALIHDAAKRLGKLRAAYSVEDHLANGDLALDGLAPGLEIDRGGEAAPLPLLELGLTLALIFEAQADLRGTVGDGLRRRRPPGERRRKLEIAGGEFCEHRHGAV